MSGRLIAATDGSAQPNPGPAGWAWVLGDPHGQPYQGSSGYLGNATNNIGELTAVAELLEATDPSVPLEIRIDSQYAMKAVTEWLPKQRARDYTTVDGKPIANRELIVRIDQLLAGREVAFTWVRAHQSGGDPLNAAADWAAQHAVQDRQGRTWTARYLQAGASVSSPDPDASRNHTGTAGSSDTCGATTKTGKTCLIAPRPSGLCHVHDPVVQCQATTSKGQRCTVATGGGRCERHRDQLNI